MTTKRSCKCAVPSFNDSLDLWVVGLHVVALDTTRVRKFIKWSSLEMPSLSVVIEIRLPKQKMSAV